MTLSFSVFAHVVASFGIIYFFFFGGGAPSVGACAFLFPVFFSLFFTRSDVWHLERSDGFGGSITTRFGN